MLRSVWTPWLWAWGLLAAAGCADNPMYLKSRLSEAEKQQTAMSRQYAQLQDRANALDRDNQEKDVLLAQTKQQVKIAEDQLAALREQLRSVTSQLAQARSDKETIDRRVQAMQASLQRQGGVTIQPNNSLLQTLPSVNHIPGANVRRDGDVIRVELPDSVLFEPGSARLRPGGINAISDAAAEIGRLYPDQIIGVEGYTDRDPGAGAAARNSHQLSVERAMAVYDVLISRSRLQGDQLFVVGHGPNHPVVSNALPEGRQRNRRVELVVYPEKKSN